MSCVQSWKREWQSSLSVIFIARWKRFNYAITQGTVLRGCSIIFVKAECCSHTTWHYLAMEAFLPIILFFYSHNLYLFFSDFTYFECMVTFRILAFLGGYIAALLKLVCSPPKILASLQARIGAWASLINFEKISDTRQLHDCVKFYQEWHLYSPAHIHDCTNPGM